MKVAELLDSPEKFIQNTSPHARDSKGAAIIYNSPDAVAWSLWGAILKCGVVEGSPGYKRLLLALHPKDRKRFMPITDFGFNHTYEEVLQLVKDSGI